MNKTPKSTQKPHFNLKSVETNEKNGTFSNIITFIVVKNKASNKNAIHTLFHKQCPLACNRKITRKLFIFYFLLLFDLEFLNFFSAIFKHFTKQKFSAKLENDVVYF